MCVHCNTAGAIDTATTIKFDAVKAIETAIKDYFNHTTAPYTAEDFSDTFITRLAKDSWTAKTELRALFRKSPAWNEELQSIVRKGSYLHTPNLNALGDLVDEIICSLHGKIPYEKWSKINTASKFFAYNEDNVRCYRYTKEQYLEFVKEIAPKAYREDKKLARVFLDFCKAAGVDVKDSEFTKRYEKISDELRERMIDFTLYISINPAHFMTMSNPYRTLDKFGMRSCHSLNYEGTLPFKNGCSGYARDNYSFIALTVDDDNKPELFNYRKTTRQVFAYKPDNGLLLQSRLYTSHSGSDYGGVDYDTPESKAYREIIQKEISELENAQNFWKTSLYIGNKHNIIIKTGEGFGGYPDWKFEKMRARISIRNDHAGNFEVFTMGTYGLCIDCGEECTRGLYCESCHPDDYVENRVSLGFEDGDEEESETCENCGEYCDETYTVYYHGDRMEVCYDCREGNFVECAECGEYHHVDDVIWVNEFTPVCRDCLRSNYKKCEECGEYYREEDMRTVIDRHGERALICDSCIDSLVEDGIYHLCDHCECYVHEYAIVEAEDSNGDTIFFCPDCAENAEDAREYVACEDCGRLIHISRATKITVGETKIYEGTTYYYCSDCAPDNSESENEGDSETENESEDGNETI